MARKRDRVFALSLAVLFFITAFGFSFWVIWQMAHQSNAASDTSSNNTTQNQTTNPSCNEDAQPTEAAIAAPSAYKTSAKITSLQSTDLNVGSGQAAKNGDCLIVKYYGTLATSGTVFDENFTKSTGFEFQLGAGQVIKGWDEGVVGMKVGGERRLVIPPSLGYGSTAQSSIPANSTLVFVVKLLQIK